MLDKPVQDLEVADLVRLWNDATQCDKSTFAEMRTNLQIVAGQHYLSEGSAYWNRIRDNKQLSEAQRIKLTKNHTQRVTATYRNFIEDASPDVSVQPANENELSDQKDAELNESYWQYIKRCEDFERNRSIWCKNYVETGEVWVKVFWDMNGGQHIGYEAEMQQGENGEMKPVLDENQQVVQSDKPVYSGKLKWETVEGYRIKRDPSATSFADSPYVFIDKLIPLKSLRTLFKDEEMIKQLEQSKATQNMVVYDSNSRTYKTAEDQALFRECYWRPCPALPKGYFQFFTDTKIVAQGELPGGIWPLINENFEDQTGNPRGFSIIRVTRPAQVELNRCASKIAEHQITLGDDKAWVPASTKVSQGATLPGIRIATYSGMKPEITAGRSGEQYFPYMESQVTELYTLANLQELMQDQTESPDLYTNLFRSLRFRKKFSLYGNKFERFLCRLAQTSLEVAKFSAHPAEVIPAVGKPEQINMEQFKSSEDLKYRIKLKPRADDIESQFGQQITINHFLQYVGQNLEKEQYGKLIRLSPFMNSEQMFSELTAKYDSVVNDILAMDRGQYRPPRRYDDHKYIIEALSSRMAKPDYEYLPGPIQYLYETKIQQHEQLQAQALQEIEKAKAGFIPSGGYLVKCDFYVPDPKNPASTKRLSLPSESVAWLVEKLKVQGSDLERLEQMPPGVLQDIGGMLNRSQTGGLPPGAMNA